MKNLQEIIAFFEKGKTPKYEEFKESWTSFWHKSEKMESTQVVGLNDNLNKLDSEKADKIQVEAIEKELPTFATKDDLQSVMGGLRPMGEVETEAELRAIVDPNDNDSYFVKETKDENGDPYIWRWDANLPNWVNTKQVVYQDVAKKGGYNGTLNDLDTATKVAQQNYYFTNKDYLIGYTTKGKRVIGGYNRKGQLNAVAGLSDELGQKVFNQIVQLTHLLNKKYIWAVFTPSGRIVLGVKKNGYTVGKFEELEVVKKRLSDLENGVNLSPLTVYLNGHSLMMGATVSASDKRLHVVLQRLLGENYNVVNHAVGGETSHTIAARQGGVPCWCVDEFVLPSDNTKVAISSMANVRLKNKFDAKVTPLLQGLSEWLNPCYVQGIECTLSYDRDIKVWHIQRNIKKDENGNDIVYKPFKVVANSPIFFRDASKYRNPHIMVLWIGANNHDYYNYLPDGYNSEENRKVLIQTYKDMIELSGCSNYIIIGDPMNTGATQSDIEKLIVTEKMLSDEFGLHFLNWREYAVNYSLEKLGITPTQSDINNIAIGKIPTSLLNDSIHYNDATQALQAELIRDRMQLLGFINKIQL